MRGGSSLKRSRKVTEFVNFNANVVEHQVVDQMTNTVNIECPCQRFSDGQVMAHLPYAILLTKAVVAELYICRLTLAVLDRVL